MNMRTIIKRMDALVKAPISTVPFTIRSDVPVEAYRYSIDFDEEVLEAVSVEPVWAVVTKNTAHSTITTTAKTPMILMTLSMVNLRNICTCSPRD
jgi:hypothetical protein